MFRFDALRLFIFHIVNNIQTYKQKIYMLTIYPIYVAFYG